MRKENFEKLYEEHAADLFAFLVYRSGNRSLAEEVLGDTFEQALRAHRRFDPRRGSAKSWLYTIALNKLRDQLRRHEVERRALERSAAGMPTHAAGLEPVEDRDEVMRAMGALNEDEREAVALRFGGDLTVPELAKVTGQSTTTAEGRLYRGLRKLRDELG
jgi:RNA polymerase sigma-70 factor (ECF subfamily)